MKPMRIFTWHVHGSYLWYLAHSRHEFWVPVLPGRYLGRTRSYAWPDNVREIPAHEVRHARFDVVLYQSQAHWLQDQFEILSDEQRRLPRIFLEHDPPRGHPTDTKHPVDDPNVLITHVTHFNRLMWDCGRSPTCVIEHGVTIPQNISYRGELERGISAVNNIRARGRRLGWDIFEQAKARGLPVDLVGMGWQEAGGQGEMPHAQLPRFLAQYRFFFYPVRYTSLGLAILEAMMIGLPIVGMATAELATVIENDTSGYVHTDPAKVFEAMHTLLRDPGLALEWGRGAHRVARERFHIDRFCRDWDHAFAQVAGLRASSKQGAIAI